MSIFALAFLAMAHCFNFAYPRPKDIFLLVSVQLVCVIWGWNTYTTPFSIVCHVLTVPELFIQFLCFLSVRSFHVTIVMESPAGKVVHVDPNSPSPVRWIMLRVVLGIIYMVYIDFVDHENDRYLIITSINFGQGPQSILTP